METWADKAEVLVVLCFVYIMLSLIAKGLMWLENEEEEDELDRE